VRACIALESCARSWRAIKQLDLELTLWRWRYSKANHELAARTWTYSRDAGASYDVSAGASLRVGRDLSHARRLDAIGEAGVSPYTRLDGERLPANAFGGQVLVALGARAAR